ncbi:MAG: T9SS type A sorting domain-containing protein [Candidatus Cloacimonetes bacterium]|nr:T9SS type A sorting domain-containing protein [Candidatus Cloacimonadota bacterium]
MKLKFIIITFFILHFTFLFSDTIIDSVYSDPLLDGEINFSQNAQAYQVNNWMYDMFFGDHCGSYIDPDPNSYVRSYISFYLPDIPEGYHIDSVYVRLYQYDSGGYDASTGTYTDFPVWNVAGGDTIKCIMSHINYGNELDIVDWEKGDVGNPYTYQNNIGTITESGINGYRYLDVTTSVIHDYEMERDKTQYRIAFQIDTDWDSEPDLVAFLTGSTQPDWAKPQLFCIFKDEVNIEENVSYSVKISLSNLPNPFNPKTTISYQIPYPEVIKLQIYNIKGQLIETLVNEYQESGKHSIIWNAENQSSGIYFYRIKSGTQTKIGKCLLVK